MVSKVYDIEPNKYRELTQLCKEEDNTTLEVLVNVVTNTEFKDLESEQSGALELLDEFKDKEEVKEDHKKEDHAHKKEEHNMKKEFEGLNIKE
jgi:hypothetical protein